MLKTCAAAAVAALGLACAPAFAQGTSTPPAPQGPDFSGFYAGGGINIYFLDKDAAQEGTGVEFVDQPSPSAFVARLGYAFNNYLAVEGEAGFGGAAQEFADAADEDDIIGEISVGGVWSAHGVATLPVGAAGTGYVLLKGGYSSVTVERDFILPTADLEIAGPSLGVGAGIGGERWDARLEYGYIFGDDDATAGVLGMSGAYRF